MAKPRSFRCRALSTFDSAPQMRGTRDGEGSGGESAAGGPGDWIWGVLGGPAQSGRDPACEVLGPVPARRGSQRFGSRPGTHILGFGVGPPRTGSRSLGRVGWAGGAFSSRFSSRSSKEPLMATSGSPVVCSHLEQQKLFFFSLFIFSPQEKESHVGV